LKIKPKFTELEFRALVELLESIPVADLAKTATAVQRRALARLDDAWALYAKDRTAKKQAPKKPPRPFVGEGILTGQGMRE
jgi:hypothetical protein